MRSIVFAVVAAVVMTSARAGASNDAGLPDPAPQPPTVIGNIIVTTSFNGTEPTMPNRVFRNGVPSACGAAKPFPGTFAAVVPYEVNTLFNNGPAQCVSVQFDATTCNSGLAVFFTAYAGSFDPANLATNYLGDAGSSTATGSFSFTAPANSAVAIMASGVVSGVPVVCSYTISSAQLSRGQFGPAAGAIPALSPWALAALGVLVALVGVVLMRRRVA
jgi:hypothetical protein